MGGTAYMDMWDGIYLESEKCTLLVFRYQYSESAGEVSVYDQVENDVVKLTPPAIAYVAAIRVMAGVMGD